MITDLLIITIFPLAMALAAGTDLFSMTVPNWIACSSAPACRPK